MAWFTLMFSLCFQACPTIIPHYSTSLGRCNYAYNQLLINLKAAIKRNDCLKRRALTHIGNYRDMATLSFVVIAVEAPLARVTFNCAPCSTGHSTCVLNVINSL